MSERTCDKQAGCPVDSRVRKRAKPRSARHLVGAFLTVALLAGCNLEDPGVRANAPEDGITGTQAAKLFLANCYEKTDARAIRSNPDFVQGKSRNPRHVFAVHKSRKVAFNGLTGHDCTMTFIGNKSKLEAEAEAAAALQPHLGVEPYRRQNGRPAGFETSKGSVSFVRGGVVNGPPSPPNPYRFVLHYSVTD